jgi:hypothetical protein
MTESYFYCCSLRLFCPKYIVIKEEIKKQKGQDTKRLALCNDLKNQNLFLLLFVTIFAQALFAFVSRNLMSLTFLTAGHSAEF